MINTREHNNALDVLRFLAAFMVVMYHLNQSIPNINNWYRNVVAHGWLGIGVFFVISGYCILLSASNTKSALSFLIKRFFRIFPAYWFSLLIVLCAAIFQKLYTGTNSVSNLPKTPATVLANISLLTYPFSKIKGINWVYWSLTCEMFFYLLIAIAISFNNKLWSILFLALISVLAIFLPDRYHTGPAFFFQSWPAFGAGAGLFLLYRQTSAEHFYLSIGIMLINVGNLLYRCLLNNNTGYFIAVIITLLVIYISNNIEFKPNLLSIWGNYSYAVYLIHVPVGVFILGNLKIQAIQQNPFLNLFYDVFIYAVISLISWQIFKYIEKPAILLGKRLSIHISKQPVDTTAY